MTITDNLLKIAADLAVIGQHLQEAGTGLAAAAAAIEQEAANLAEEKSKQLGWGVHVAVNVQANGQPQTDFRWNNDDEPKASGALKN